LIQANVFSTFAIQKKELMSIEFHIHKLLYTNDCVVLPGFGGFVSSYASAKIHPINHTFYPPSKSILFNSKLIQDDGLLIHHIALSENLDYQDAKNRVAKFVDTCKAELDQSNSIKLPQIGKIRKDVEGSLLFDPNPDINYLEDSFGLPAFVSPAIVRQPIHKRLEKRFNDRRPLVNHTSSGKRKVKWAYLAVIPVLLFAAWLSFNVGNNNNTQESGIIPVNNSEITDSPEQSKSTDEKTDLISNMNESESLSNPESSETEMNLPVEKPDLIIKKDEITTPKEFYYIIGGAFRNPDNSDKMIVTLRNKGYDAKPAGQSKTGLHMVCYLQTQDKLEALMNLSLIRKEDNPSAWLLKK